jgi:hypothetical protein
LEDLQADLQKWIQAGEQVIVMLDANEDICDGAVQQMFSQMGMHKVLLECNAYLPETSTYSRNFQDTPPIDGIFATPSINLQAGGYLAFGEGPGVDHRALIWLDISYQVAFGQSAPAMGQSNARQLTRRLMCTDPRIRQRYIEIFRRFVQQH